MCYKKAIIEVHVEDLIEQSVQAMKRNLQKVFRSGCIDIEGYDEKANPMILPKAIITALLLEESTQYTAPPSQEKAFKKEVKNIGYHI